MNVTEMLNERHKELKDSIATVEQEIRQIEAALKAIGDTKEPKKAPIPAANTAKRFAVRHSMPVNEAVLLAVKAGRKSPVSILEYIQNELKIDTTISSIRSRVSPLYKKGKIARDKTGWIPATDALGLAI